MGKIRSILFWSIITAAFIGPGTVTTAAKAGSSEGLGLLWALLFSILATMVLQEMAARLTLATGKPLGEIIGTSASMRTWNIVLFASVALGCGAYQAGNLLGTMAGLSLVDAGDKVWLILLVLLAASLLWQGNTRLITRNLAAVVALMGGVFCWVAFSSPVGWEDWAQGVIPRVSDSTALLAIGLVGTTIVPYNLFLASGLSRGQNLREMRQGLGGAILIGGAITLAIMLAGTLVTAPFTFQRLGTALGEQLGGKGQLLLALGLSAAGFSSAITAPMAAAITGQALLGSNNEHWQNQGKNFRLTWGIILAVGTLFALTEVQPIPAIIAAQAINGVILPLVAIFLLLKINDPTIIPTAYRHGQWLNVLGLLIIGVTVVLGGNGVWSACGKVIPAVATVALGTKLAINTVLATVIVVWVALRLRD